MKPGAQTVVLLPLTIIFIGRPVQGKYYYGDQGNEGNNQMYQSYDYSYAGAEEMMCYVCTYHVRDGQPAGQQGCTDPFRKEDTSIIETPCDGPCAVIYTRTGEMDFTITRGCLPKCVDHREALTYTNCCHRNLCNAAVRMQLGLQWAFLFSIQLYALQIVL